jgi:hypothetical protein
MSDQDALGHKHAQEILAKYIITGEILKVDESQQLDKLT